MKKWQTRLQQILYTVYALSLLAILASWFTSLAANQNSGITIALPVTGYDPADPFFGRYINIRTSYVLDIEQPTEEQKRFAAPETDKWPVLKPGNSTSQQVYYLNFSAAGKMLYPSKQAAEGGYYIKDVRIYQEKPAHNALQPTGRRYRISLPFRRYYLASSQADDIDKNWRKIMQNEELRSTVRLQVRLGKDGLVTVKGLEVGEVPLEKYSFP